MFTVLVYKSRVAKQLIGDDLTAMVNAAAMKNQQNAISGVLLYDGDYFLQYLEGPDVAIKLLYHLITLDDRHRNVVKLMEDFSPTRRFGGWSMYCIDVQKVYGEDIYELLASGATFESVDSLPSHDRVIKLITAFASSRWDDSEQYSQPQSWHLESQPSPFAPVMLDTLAPALCQFAFQPILSPLTGLISSIEALIRSPSGGSPQSCFEGLSPEALYAFDLESKQHALALASQMQLGAVKLALNLLPMSLIRVPHAVEKLLGYIAQFDFKPQQIIVEITEQESISNFEDFQAAIKELRSAGISVSIDDFGAGFAGLTLLSKFQPEKLKVDRSIVENIHQDGPKQAIVRAMVECAHALGITIVAEGVETMEEWCWLQSAGVDLFQGFLFAKPMLNGVAPIHWPVQTP
jgi:EAL domain-containing protein (putative c-di-GMP-specific phosphodiesterase class I)